MFGFILELLFEFLFEFLFETIGQLIGELVIEGLWHAARGGQRSATRSVRSAALVDSTFFIAVAAAAVAWGIHTANMPDPQFPISTLSTLTLAVVAGSAALANVATPATWPRLFQFNRARWLRLCSIGLIATVATSLAYLVASRS